MGYPFAARASKDDIYARDAPTFSGSFLQPCQSLQRLEISDRAGDINLSLPASIREIYMKSCILGCDSLAWLIGESSDPTSNKYFNVFINDSLLCFDASSIDTSNRNRNFSSKFLHYYKKRETSRIMAYISSTLVTDCDFIPTVAHQDEVDLDISSLYEE